MIRLRSDFLRMIKIRHLFTFIIGTCILVTLIKFNQSSKKSSQTFENYSHTADDQINLNQLYHLGNCLLEEAGNRIVEISQSMDNTQFELKGDKSRVTQADIESNKIIMHALQYKYKFLRVKSEEDGDLEKKDEQKAQEYLRKCDTYVPTEHDSYFHASDLVVWVDPLDATQEYSENLTNYVTVMFCIAIKGEPRVGIIHKPFSKYTVKSFLEQQPMREYKTPKANRIIISRSHGEWFDEYVKTHMALNATIISAGGSGYKTIELLENRADLYMHLTTIKKWDICAPQAILTNMGGALRTRTDEVVDFADFEHTKAFGFIAALESFNFYWDSFRIDKTRN